MSRKDIDSMTQNELLNYLSGYRNEARVLLQMAINVIPNTKDGSKVKSRLSDFLKIN